MIFSISPVNSLSFVKIDTSLPNFTNTLYQDMDKIVAKIPYCQMQQKADVITIQVKTDYTSLTAWMYNIATGAVTALTPSEVTSYSLFAFWEIPITFSDNGFFKVFISGTLLGSPDQNFVSEMIEVRDSWESLKVEAYNSVNTGEVDYSTGLTHIFRVPGLMKFSDVGGKDEFYNNFGIEERIYSENETIYELTIEQVPYYLVRQLIYCGRLDTFTVNDLEFIVKEHSPSPHPGSHDFDLVMKLTQKQVLGIAVYTGFDVIPPPS
jgi:hypothetical protein